MKRLRSYTGIIGVMSPAMAIGIVMGIFAFVALFEDEFIDVGVSLVILSTAIFMAVWLICRIFGLNRDHWIEYGDGKIVIHRYSKIIDDRMSKMQIRQTEFLLEEIELYGPSLRVLGKNVEFDGALTTPSFNSEVFFQLKDGRRIGFYVHNFGKFQHAELNRYIYGETGIKMTLHKLDLK